jgi:hypothetical protein
VHSLVPDVVLSLACKYGIHASGRPICLLWPKPKPTVEARLAPQLPPLRAVAPVATARPPHSLPLPTLACRLVATAFSAPPTLSRMKPPLTSRMKPQAARRGIMPPHSLSLSLSLSRSLSLSLSLSLDRRRKEATRGPALLHQVPRARRCGCRGHLRRCPPPASMAPPLMSASRYTPLHRDLRGHSPLAPTAPCSACHDIKRILLPPVMPLHSLPTAVAPPPPLPQYPDPPHTRRRR